MEHKQDLRMKRTCRILSYTLFSLLTQKSYEQIRIEEICQKAFIHRTTFYHYFNNKNDLLSYAIDEVKEKIFDTLHAKHIPAEQTEEMFLQLAKIAIHFLYENRTIIEQIMHHNPTHPMIEIFTESISRSIKYLFVKNRKQFPSLTIHKDILAQFLTGGCIQMAVWWLENKTPISEEEFYENVKILMKQQTYLPLS